MGSGVGGGGGAGLLGRRTGVEDIAEREWNTFPTTEPSN